MKAEFDPRDPANASGVVAFLGSEESGWLTGQVFRIDGDRVQRMRGWQIVGEHRSSAGGAVTRATSWWTDFAAMYEVMPPGVNTLSRA